MLRVFSQMEQRDVLELLNTCLRIYLWSLASLNK